MEQPPKLKYKRILLKLSGEVLKNREKGDCIDAGAFNERSGR